MDIIGEGLMAIGKAIAAWASAYGVIYVVGIASKTFLIYTEKAKIEEMKNWFDFGFKKKGNRL